MTTATANRTHNWKTEEEHKMNRSEDNGTKQSSRTTSRSNEGASTDPNSRGASTGSNSGVSTGSGSGRVAGSGSSGLSGEQRQKQSGATQSSTTTSSTSSGTNTSRSKQQGSDGEQHHIEGSGLGNTVIDPSLKQKLMPLATDAPMGVRISSMITNGTSSISETISGLTQTEAMKHASQLAQRQLGNLQRMAREPKGQKMLAGACLAVLTGAGLIAYYNSTTGKKWTTNRREGMYPSHV